MAGFGNLRAYESKTTKKKTTTNVGLSAANTGKYAAPKPKTSSGGSIASANTGKYSVPSDWNWKPSTPAKTTVPSKSSSVGISAANVGKYSSGSSKSSSSKKSSSSVPKIQSIAGANVGKYAAPKVSLGFAVTPGQQYAKSAIQRGGNPYLSIAGGLAQDVMLALPEAAVKGVISGGNKIIQAVRGAAPRIITAGKQAAPRIISAVEQAAPRAPEHLWGRTYQIARNVLQRGAQTAKQGVQQLRNAPPSIKVGGTLGVGGAALYGLDRLSSQGAPAPGGGPSAPSPGPQPQILPPSDANTPNVMTPGGGDSYTPGYSPTGYTGNSMGGTPAGAQGQTVDTTAFPPLPGEQAQTPPPEQPPLPEQPPMPEQPDWEALLREQMDVIQQAAQQNAALATSFLNQSLQQLDQLQAQIMAQFQQMGQGIDPATQAALQNLREEINLRRQNLMEEMNRRGLLQSGVWLEMENRILKGQMTQEEQLVASRLADVQNRMTDALMQFASQRMNLMGQAAQNQMATGRWASEAQLNALQTIQGRQDEWNRWWQELQMQQRQMAQEQARWQYEQQFNRAKQIADWAGTIPEGYPGAGQQTWEARMKEQELAIERQRAASGGGGGSLSTQYKIAKEAEEEAWNRAIDNYVATNFPRFRTKADLVAQLYRNYSNIVAQYGIDGFRAIMDEADKLPDGWMGQGWLAARR